jgi:integrase
MSRDGIFKRCACTEVVDGKRRQLGVRCPKLRRKGGAWSSTHGSWWYRIQDRVVAQPVRGGGFESRDDAERERDQVRERARRGATVVRCPQADVFLTEWLDGKADLAASTRRSYAAHIRNHLVPPLGHLRLVEVRVGHVAEAIGAVEGTGATRQRVRATLRSALNDAIREGLIVVSAAALVRLPAGKRPKALVWTDERVQRWAAAVERLNALHGDDPARKQLEAAAQPPSPVMVWTPAQLGRFLDAAHDDRLYALWHLVAHRGLRRGEVCAVEWQDVDLNDGTLVVCRQPVQLGWDVIESPPKSDAGRRTVALDMGTVAALRTHRRAQVADRLAWGEAWQETGKVFVREDGSCCTRRR